MTYVPARFAAAVLRANGATDLPAGITDAAGYNAYLHPDPDTAWRHHAELVHPYGTTLIGFGNVEGGWLFLYDTRPRGATP
jgi:hypothetical protein